VRAPDRVIVRLFGGLGNQLFQYAAGRAASIPSGRELVLDPWHLATLNERSYALAPFRVAARLANPRDIPRCLRPEDGRRPSRLVRSLRRRLGSPGITVCRESASCQSPELLPAPGTMYLVGYWQSEKYFVDQEDIIRGDLRLRKPLTERNAAAAEELGRLQSVALHVRRGDYVRNPEANRYHGVCGIDYYERAIAFLEDTYSDLRYFVFTDDPEWVHAEMHLPIPFTVCDWNGTHEAHLDLNLMSACRFHVIANSTFSWWGAWLGSRPGKDVIAPHRWFAGADPARHPTDDLIPSSWRVM